jgi:hypothetical protein
MAKRDIHVVPTELGWAVKREGDPIPVASFPTKEPAMKSGRALADADQVELVEHGSDGQIQG